MLRKWIARIVLSILRIWIRRIEMENINRVKSFLMLNGWKPVKSGDPGLHSFEKENNISIDIMEDEIVLIGWDGDFNHIPLNYFSDYTLMGYLLHHRYISIDYKFNR
jgi:hypothetical protein